MYSVLSFYNIIKQATRTRHKCFCCPRQKKESLFLRRCLDLVASYNWRSTHNNIHIFYYSVRKSLLEFDVNKKSHCKFYNICLLCQHQFQRESKS